MGRDLLDTSAHFLKEWRSVAHDFSLSFADHISLSEAIYINEQEYLLNMNVGVPSPFWCDWEWNFGCPLV